MYVVVGSVICGSGAPGKKIAASVFNHLANIDRANADRLVRASLHAGRRFAHGQPRGTHIAFANDAPGLVIFRNVIRTLEYAVLASDALIVEVVDDAGNSVFFICVDGATIEACRFDAMMTCGGDVLHHG